MVHSVLKLLQSWFCRPQCWPRAWVQLSVYDLKNGSHLWNGHWPAGIGAGFRLSVWNITLSVQCEQKEEINFCLSQVHPHPVYSAPRSSALSPESALSLFSLPKPLSCWLLKWSVSLSNTGHCQRLSWEVSVRGVFAKCDTIVRRHFRSLPSPEVDCQCKCHIDLTFTSLESGKGLAVDTLQLSLFQ